MISCTTDNLEEGNVFTLKCNGPDGWPYPKTTWFVTLLRKVISTFSGAVFLLRKVIFLFLFKLLQVSERQSYLRGCVGG